MNWRVWFSFLWILQFQLLKYEYFYDSKLNIFRFMTSSWDLGNARRHFRPFCNLRAAVNKIPVAMGTTSGRATSTLKLTTLNMNPTSSPPHERNKFPPDRRSCRYILGFAPPKTIAIGLKKYKIDYYFTRLHFSLNSQMSVAPDPKTIGSVLSVTNLYFTNV